MLLFIILGISTVFAENQYSGIRILLKVVPEEPGMDTKLNTVISNLFVFELGAYGFISEKVQSSSGVSPEPILPSNPGSDLILICTHTANGYNIMLDTKLYENESGKVLSSNVVGAELDLSFDTVIASLVSDLIKKADRELNIMAEKAAPVSKEKIEEETIEKEIKISGEDSSVKIQKGGMELFLDAGITVGVGDSQNALQEPGLIIGISFNYWFLSQFGFFGIGVHSSANLYSVSDQTDNSNLFLFPIGVNAGYSSPTDRLFSIMFQIGSGPAIASLIYGNADPLVKVIPYVSTDFRLRFNFHKKMSLGLKAAYNIYFEEASMLTTMSSSVYVSFRSWN